MEHMDYRLAKQSVLTDGEMDSPGSRGFGGESFTVFVPEKGA